MPEENSQHSQRGEGPLRTPTVFPLTESGYVQLGKYQLEGLIGRGAMAEVYKATHPTLERAVALKVIHPRLARDPAFVERFRREARVVAALRHPGIVQIHDFDTEGGVFYMVMEFVPGESLHERLESLRQRGTYLSLQETLRIFRQIVEAVAYAHTQGVVHRDLKPANVLLNTEDRPILTDFGLSKIVGIEQLTHEGAIIGTPAYMSPEQGSGEAGDERSDIYALGVMLYELTTNIPPFSAESPISVILKHLDEPVPPPHLHNADLPPSIEQIIKKALEKIPAHRYQSAQALLDALNTVVIPQSTGKTMALPANIPCPYRGLQAFEEEHAHFYFGREVWVQQLITCLTGKEDQPAPHFLAVLGASGSGKSSLVRAGLIPALRKGTVPGSDTWIIILMQPGNHPLQELAAQLAAIGEQEGGGARKQGNGSYLNDAWFEAGTGLHIAAYRLLEMHACDPSPLPSPPTPLLSCVPTALPPHLVLVIDQFEEVFTLCQSEYERARFIENLLYATAVNGSRVLVVLTMRADFYHRCAVYRDLAARISAHQILVGPMQEAELRRAIELPAHQVGLAFEVGLVEVILHDVQHQPGALPLLQHALLELWGRREDALLTIPAYQASGGVTGAIAQRADTLYMHFNAVEQAIVRRIMLRLTHPGEGTEDTRRRARRQELLPHTESLSSDLTENVLQTLVDARLVTTSRDMSSGEELVDVAHEALIRGWMRLRNWIDEDRVALHIHRQLTQAAELWEHNERNISYLYHGLRLAQAEEWRKTHNEDLNVLEKTFLDASHNAAEVDAQELEAQRQRELAQAQALAEAEHQRAEIQSKSTRRLRRFAAGLWVVFLLAMCAAFFAKQQRQEAERQAILSEAARAEAVSAEATANTAHTEAERSTRLAIARQLSAQSQSILEKYPQRGILLALEALKATLDHNEDRVPAAESALRAGLARLQGRVLSGHTDKVVDVALTPDQDWIVTAGNDHTIRVWNIHALDEAPILLTGHTDDVHAIAVTSRWIVSASADGTARLWDLEDLTRAPIILAGHEGEILALALSPDGQWLATGGDDTALRLWKLEALSAQPLIFTEHEESILTLTFSADSQWVASGGEDHVVHVWNLQNLDMGSYTLMGNHGSIRDVAFSPDNRWLAACSDGEGGVNTVLLWQLNDLTSDPISLAGHKDNVWTLEFTSDSRWLATGGDWPDNTIRLWDLHALDAAPIVLTGHVSGIRDLLFSPRCTYPHDDCWLFSASSLNGDNTIRIWNMRALSTQPIVLSGHDGMINKLAITADGQQLISASHDHTARLWNLRVPIQPQDPMIIQAHADRALAVTFSPDGCWLVTAGADRVVNLWDRQKPETEPITLRGHTGEINALAISADSQWLASGSADGSVRLWSMAQPDASPIVLSGSWEGIWGVAISPDGQWIAAVTGDPLILLWDLEQLLYSSASRMSTEAIEPVILTGHETLIFTVAFTPDGERLITGSFDNTVRIWNFETLETPPTILADHEYAVSTVAMSPNGHWLVTGSWDTTARVWDLNDLSHPPTVLSGHGAGVSGLAIDPESRWLVTVNGDKIVRLWDLELLSAPPVLLTGHTAILSGAAISHDGHWLATTDWDGMLRIWNMHLDELMTQACQVVNRNLTPEEWETFFYGQPYRQTCP
ncbi:MAG: protein kinase [Anaerolineae bacterium]|nr:protein kinase [Anaerolineae bacterium]